MDPRSDGRPSSLDDFNSESHVPLPDPDQSPDFTSGFKHYEPALGLGSFTVPPLSSRLDALNNMPADGLHGGMPYPAELDGGNFEASSSLGTRLNAGGEPPSSYDGDSSDPILKYISQILMEENIEEKLWVPHNDFALRSTEKSFYDALGEQYPNSPDHLRDFVVSRSVESPNENTFGGISGEKSCASTVLTSINCSYSADPNRPDDHVECNQTINSAFHPLDQVPLSNFGYHSPFLANSLSHSATDANALVDSSLLVKNAFSDNNSVLQFKTGFEEASKFLPPSNQLCVSFENVSAGSGAIMGTLEVDVNDYDEGGREVTLDGSRGRRNHEREDLCLGEQRATKQSASYVEVEKAELSDMLDKVLLWTEKGEHLGASGSSVTADGSEASPATASVRESSGRRRRARKQENNSSADLRALLIQCAQAVYSNDIRSANELLRQIRENSSPSGDGSQRLAHYFANGLEARMAGNDSRTRSYFSVVHKRRSVAEILKAFQLHLSSCPFKKLSMIYMNHMIWKLSQKASILHIIDFGIGFGFQWPILIQKLGEQTGITPKLRITGIELPDPGFRPAEGIEETGRRLAQYCERFDVPFEYNGLASQNWEDIKIEDLKIKSGEMIAVNCFMRFKNLLDETVKEDGPRDAVLSLIRKIRPDVFLHAAPSASYNAPFFVTRFREALFHMSSIYDMLDATNTGVYKYSEERLLLESEFYGRDIMNLVACEGPERVERPESYKQWLVRHARAGFKQLPLDQALMKGLRHKLETCYHKNFTLDEDGDWLLFGWKGRIIYGTACLVPM